jgi:DNA-binding response OmpR family regulator
MTAKKRVLVVDDEPGIRRFVSTSLGLAGFDVTTTGSGEEALKLAETQNPDIILLDILMQPLSGFDVLERLRKFSQVPVIVFTARKEIADLAMKEGANGFIMKPFIPDELVKKIGTSLKLNQ